MKIGAKPLLEQTAVVFAIALIWAGAFELNEWIFAGLEHTLRANWIFLPAVIRPLAILLFGGWGAAGLVLGALLTVYGATGGDQLHAMNLALTSGLMPWLAVSLSKRVLNIPETLAGLRAKHIAVICVFCAAFNSLALNAHLWATGRLHEDLMQVAAVFVGDVLGPPLGYSLFPACWPL